MKFNHYILTRFNLLTPEVDIYNNPNIEDPHKWMFHRINLFDRYTLPSVMKQTCKEFTWLLAFSNKTDPAIIRRYANLQNIKIIYEYPVNYLRRTYDKEWLLTTRFDNDDILLPTFVEKLQDHVIKSAKKGSFRTEVIDVLGVQWDMKSNKWYDSGRNMFNSPFLSLFENTKKSYLSCEVDFGEIKGVKTAMYCSHTKMIQHFPACRIEKSLAVMCIHDRNVANKIVGGELKDASYFKTLYK